MNLGTGFDWSVVLDVGVGVGVFVIGIGVFIAMTALARTLRRLDATLDGIDDQVIARLTGIVGSLERVTESLANTAKLTQDAVSPAIVNVGAALGGISAGLRRIVRGNGSGENT
jgi:uncharacterized protein YoxC